MHPSTLREWALPLLVALALIMLGSLPYAYAYRNASGDEVFMGFIGRGTQGANSYLSLARQAAEGHTLMTNLCTPEPRPRAFFHAEWWLFGWVARVTGWSLLTVFHVGRIVTVLGFCLALYYFLTAAVPRRGPRMAAFMLIIFGAGLGWVVYGANAFLGTELPWPLDIRGVTVFGYLANKPHFIRGGIFAALSLGLFLRGAMGSGRGYFLLSGIAGSLGGLIRPFHLPDTLVFLTAYAGYMCWQERRFNREAIMNAGLVVAGLLPVIAMYAWLSVTNPMGLSRDPFPAPHLLLVALWLGLPLIAVAAQASARGMRALPSLPRESALLVLWLLAGFACALSTPYYPYAYESYYPFVLVPPVLFLRHTLPRLRDALRARGPGWPVRPLLGVLVAALVLPSNGLVYAKFFNDIDHPDTPWRYTLPQDVVAALEWLETETPEGAVVLANHGISQFIPSFAGRKIVAGQDVIMTQDYARKTAEVSRFYHSRGDDPFKRWLCSHYGVDYLLFAAEDRLPHGIHPAEHPWLEPVFETPRATVYRVMTAP